MDFHRNHSAASFSSSSSSPPSVTATPNLNTTTSTSSDPMQSWWESISRARSRIQYLSSILSSPSLIALADSDHPARSLLSSSDVYASISCSLSGSASDPLCNWLYDTFLSSDPDLCLVVLAFVPILSALYLLRISSTLSLPSLAGFEAVLLAIYASETKSRAGRPLLLSVPDLSQPSLYHTPRSKLSNTPRMTSVGVLSAPLEPQTAVKSTKRACIIGVALDCYYKQISQMPACSKIDLCQFAAAWAGQNCSCKAEFDEEESVNFDGGDEIEDVAEEVGKLSIQESGADSVSKGSKIPLPWELLHPLLRILGHCLLAPLNAQEVKDAASVAIRCLYARASHDLNPQAILATRSLIQLDNRSRSAAKAAAIAANATSAANTPSKAKKPEILLVSK